MLPVGSWENHDEFEKQILVPGTGDVKPNRGSVCDINIANAHNVDLHKLKLRDYDPGHRVEVTIGKKNGFLPGFFDKVIVTMKEGEHAYFIARVDAVGENIWLTHDANRSCKFYIYLRSFQRFIDIDRLGYSERIEMIQKNMDKGSQLLRANELMPAMRRYEATLEYLMMSISLCVPRCHQRVQHQTFIVQCHLNIADILFEKKEFRRVIEHCYEVLKLDNKCTEALFCRGQAYFEQFQLREARADFVTLLNIEPKNKEAQKKIAHIDSIRKCIEANRKSK